MTRKGLAFFFLLPFAGIVILVFLASTLNRTAVQRGAEKLAREQLAAAAEILKAGVSRAMENGEPPAGILDRYEADENIYFMAVLDETGRIVGWKSRFEGYLPLSLRGLPPAGSQIIDSPAGRIFSSFDSFTPKGGKRHSLYLGYSLGTLDAMLAGIRRSSFIVFGIIAALGLVLVRGIIQLQSGYLAREREAEEARTEKKRFQEISAFTSGIAHEIKNPLNRLQLLFESLAVPEARDIRDKASLGKDEIARISTTIDRFSDALRPLRPRPETLPVKPILDSILDSLAAEFPSAPGRTRLAVAEGLAVKADGHLFPLALANLLRNAYEASAAGEVIVTGEEIRKTVRLTVRDSGPGLPPEGGERIFEPFFTTKAKGTGIGLYLARKIIEAHKGTVEARPGETGGTVFVLRVPGA